LESPILTKKVWDELYEIFKLHFSTEMPFLHPPTFRNRMRQAAFPRDPSTTAADLEEGRVLLLGVLTLTARFHDGLVAYHSPGQQDPLAASEYYANALATAFGPTIRVLTNPSLESIQALLMLGLYEWGQTRGLSAWLYIGIAVRLAQSMGLTYEDDQDDSSRSHSANDARKAGALKTSASPREDAIDKEVRRRTLWSCFIMDRMLAAGKYRPTMMAVNNLRVQLPCSDDQFLFVHNVKTGYLNPDWLKPKYTESSINDDGVLSRYIRLVEIFGRLSEWSYAGGRRTEEHPPWDKATEFFKLRRELQKFHDALPSNLTLTEANLSAHIEKRNATTYASLHTLYSLCLIMLHREYIPFIPLRCNKPSGPLDEPTFPKDEVPPGFWEESAEQIMRASRDIIDIVSTCQENDFLPESPQIGFAVWQAAFVCVYATYFPQMDEQHHLVPRDTLSPSPDVNANLNKGLPGRTKKILSGMVPRLRMGKRYLKSIDKMNTYFHDVHRTYCVKWKRKPYPGGGLEQYKQFEKELKEFGDLRDPDQNVPSEGSEIANEARSRASTNDIAGSSVNGEAMQGVESAAQRPNGAWAAVNAASPPVEVDDRQKYAHGPYPYGTHYQQSPNQSSTAPSLMSVSNGDSTSSLISPYGNAQSQLQQHYNINPAQQQPHMSNYRSMSQHTMAPPTTQAEPDIAGFEPWMGTLERYHMGLMDDLGQHNSSDIFSIDPAANSMNYMQALSAQPQIGAGAAW
jgi:Fungal specific transcription factor domain